MEHIPHFSILEGVNRTNCNINRKEQITASFIFHEVLMGIQRRQDRILFAQRPRKKLNRAWFACGLRKRRSALACTCEHVGVHEDEGRKEGFLEEKAPKLRQARRGKV